MWAAQTISEAQNQRSMLEGRVALVATLGALHGGHLALMKRAKEVSSHLLVSIFVNPTQFGPNEDFRRYPRPIEADLALCRSAGVDGVFHPNLDQMFDSSKVGSVVNVPRLADILEGEHRPNHFAGVCRVVLKLLNILQPHVTCFGQKDYQQLKVVQALCHDLNLPVEIVVCPTERDLDGLALSSRNHLLSGSSRRRGLGLVKALRKATILIERDGQTDPAFVERVMHHAMVSNGVSVDYASIRHPDSLATLDCIDPNCTDGTLALVAGRVNDVRLIDNMLIGQASADS